ncbi:unnamed protein product [Schistocephalus solidus]|uniref:Uncharacterized protein n=1 Tax=Schistocephalus solidus TaxID=70667 RepID=A0A183T159_SCHSO|nr:unnamed protein product [Schistocephalus solidus]
MAARETDFFCTPEVLGKQANLLRLNDALEDEEEVEEQASSAANLTIALPSAQTLFPSEDADTEGSDLLNLISTSLDRFNAQLHMESACTDSVSTPRNQRQSHQPQDCGIPIPIAAYPQVSGHTNPLSENFSNSLDPLPTHKFRPFRKESPLPSLHRFVKTDNGKALQLI